MENAHSSNNSVVAVVLNIKSGTLSEGVGALPDLFRKSLESHGRRIEIVEAEGSDVVAKLEIFAKRPDVEIIVAAGGDGTISAAADLCWKNGKTLGVVPGGTMNFVARSLELPLDPEQSILALKTARPMFVDICTANDRSFMHQFSVGLQTRVVHAREKIGYRGRIGKMLVGAWILLRNLARPPRFRVTVKEEHNETASHVSFLAVSNNVYGEGHLPFADQLDGGRLGIYSIPHLPIWHMLRLATHVARGQWRESTILEDKIAISAVTLRFDKLKRGALASIDGELVPLEKDVEIVQHKRALSILAPETPKKWV